jgi:Na+/phosphate symporter
MIFIGMTQSELIQHLYDEICRQNTMYVSIIGLLVTAFAYFQWRLSDRKVRKIEREIKKVQVLTEELKVGTKAIAQYSLENMALDGKFDATPSWEQNAKMYLSTEQLLSKELLKDEKLQSDLRDSKRSILKSAESEFREMFDTFCSNSNEKFEDIIRVNEDTKPSMFIDERLAIRVGGLIEDAIGQKKWFHSIGELNNFIDSEALD